MESTLSSLFPLTAGRTHATRRPASEAPAVPAEEAAWLAEARLGDPDAFGRLVTRYADRVFETVLRIVRSRETAEEVAQDAFVRAWKALPSFRGESRFSTWLYTIATRRALDAARSDGRRRDREGPVDREILENAPDPGASRTPGELRRLERILGELEPLRRAVVTLHYLRDRSVEEVAGMLDLPQGTVKTHLFRARASLRQAWARETKQEARRGLPGI